MNLFQYPLPIQPTEAKEFLPCALLDKCIRQPDVEGVPEDLIFVQEGVDGAARAAGYDVLLYCHYDLVAVGEFDDELFVQGLDKAHVHDGGVEFLSCCFRWGDHAAPGEDGDAFASLPNFGLANRQGGEFFFYGNARAFAPGVSDRCRALVQEAGGEHLAAFVFVGGRHDGHVGDAAEVAVVEAAGVGGAVRAYKPCPVQGKQDIEVLDGNVVDKLVVGALQEGGIYCHDGLRALAGLACGQGDGVLFGDGDIKIAFGVKL